MTPAKHIPKLYVLMYKLCSEVHQYVCMYNGDEYINDLRLNSFNGAVQHVIDILFTFKSTFKYI